MLSSSMAPPFRVCVFSPQTFVSRCHSLCPAKSSTLHLSSTPFRYDTLRSDPVLSLLLRNKDTQATVKAHIKLLHDYNEIRDVGQGLMGIIADTKGVRVRDVYQDFGVGEGD